jgi:hypothetical protein
MSQALRAVIRAPLVCPFRQIDHFLISVKQAKRSQHRFLLQEWKSFGRVGHQICPALTSYDICASYLLLLLSSTSLIPICISFKRRVILYLPDPRDTSVSCFNFHGIIIASTNTPQISHSSHPACYLCCQYVIHGSCFLTTTAGRAYRTRVW